MILTDITFDDPIFDNVKNRGDPIDDEFRAQWKEKKLFEARKNLFEISTTKEILTHFTCFGATGGLTLVIFRIKICICKISKSWLLTL